jgi:hypothetical protein
VYVPVIEDVVARPLMYIQQSFLNSHFEFSLHRGFQRNTISSRVVRYYRDVLFERVLSQRPRKYFFRRHPIV